MKDIREEWLGTVRDFIGLWDRFGMLYLDAIAPDEVTDAREDEFLEFQGAMVEQLVRVVEVERDRFDLHGLTMSVIHDAPSLRYLARQSEFQQRRLRQRWAEVGEVLLKLRSYCETYSPRSDKTSRLELVRRANPFWNPTEGSFQATLTKLVVGPVTFFSGLRPGRDEKTNRFLFKVVVIPALIVFLVLAIIHRDTVEQMAFNFGETSGLYPDREDLVPKLMAYFFILLGIFLLGLVTSLVLMVLALLHAAMLHVAFKLFGGKANLTMTYKIVVYGSGALVAIITAPYLIVLQIIGANRVHRIAPVLAPFAWLIGTALLAGLVLAVMFGVYHFTGQIPEPGQFVKVTVIDATLYSPDPGGKTTLSPAEKVAAGVRLDYEETTERPVGQGAKVEVYRVKHKGEVRYLPCTDGVLDEFRSKQLPVYMLRLTWDKLIFVVRRLSRGLGAEAD
ncbi:MAG: hypothetical protein JW889_15645 [Verrucomicrobia bacterium]|nr:hypothetical protein [Verrucomicrobiota bacterium]